MFDVFSHENVNSSYKILFCREKEFDLEKQYEFLNEELRVLLQIEG